MDLKNNVVFDTTTDNRTYNICSFARSGHCCRRCRTRERRKWYRISQWGNTYPNWKLVSKNKKQWMNKPLKYQEREGHRGTIYYNITW